MQKITHLLKAHWPIIILVFFAVILRLYKLEELFYFSFDEAIPAFVGKNMLEIGKIPLIGGVTPFGVHLTPYFYWLLGVTIAAGNLDPAVWGIVSAMLSALTVILIFIVGKEFFNKKVAYLASIIWTFSYVANLYDRHFWALYWGPMLCLLTLLSLKKIIEGNKKYVFLLSVIFIWSISTDPSNLVFIFTSTAVYLIYKLKFGREELFGLLFVLLSFAPLFIFDLRHNFSNSKPILEYLAAEKSASRFQDQTFLNRSEIFTNAQIRLVYPFTDNEVAKQYSYCANFVEEKYTAIPNVIKITSLLLIGIFLVLSVKAKSLGPKLISIVVIVYFVGIQAYGILFNGDIFEHYLTGLFPVFVLILSTALCKLPMRITSLLVAIFLITNLNKLSMATNNHGLADKRQAVEYVSNKLQNEQFSLDSVSTCWKYSGYRYLFSAYGKEPIKSYVDPNLGHLYSQTYISADHPEKVVAFITHDFTVETNEFYKRYATLKAKELESKLFGNIEVIIVDNKDHWF